MTDVTIVGAAVLDNFVILNKSYANNAEAKKTGDVDECFVLGSKIEVKRILQQSGGGATNAAFTFQRQGLSGALYSKLGDDSAGRLIIEELKDEGINTKFITKDPSGTSGQSVILVDPSGERTALTDKGTSGHIHVDNLDNLHINKSRWLYLTSLNGEHRSIEFVLSWALENSVKIAWNPGIAEVLDYRNLVKSWIPKISLLLLNKSETTALLGREGEIDELAADMQKFGAKRVVITDGKNSMAIIDGQQVFIIKPEVIKAVDQTGAGDAFGSGTVSGLLKGLNFRQAIDLGMLNAAHVVTKYGAKTGIVFSR
jgi:ribokinase